MLEINKIYCGDALEVLRGMPNCSVNMCVTSPPYYGLRDYGAPGQMGLEETPEEYIKTMVGVFREVRRVLKDDGTLWVNIGDSYATRSGSQPPTNTRNQCGHTKKKVPSGYKYKDMIGIPWMLAFALRADGWYLRQDIIWSKPNPMPESVRDRCTKSHEYVFLLSKSPCYYFSQEAIAERVADSTIKRLSQNVNAQNGSKRAVGKSEPMKAAGNGTTRNKRDVWSVATRRFSGAHFAVFPPELIEPCILAGCAPGGVVLDPFMGSGTTGMVAKSMWRNFVGIDVNPEYVNMATRRIEGVEMPAEQQTLFNGYVPAREVMQNA